MAKRTVAIEWIWQQPDWPAFAWQVNRLAPVLRTINQLQGKLLGSAKTIESGSSLHSELDALLQNAMNTSAIEGEKLNESSVRSSLARRLGVKQAGMPAGTPQSDGLAELLLDATHNYKKSLTLSRLYKWHKDLFPKGRNTLTTIRVGKLRGEAPMQVVSGRIGKQTVHFEAPPRRQLKHELQTFIDWFNHSRDDANWDPLLRAGVSHLWFVTLHPFDDGNGRLARAITDLALAQAEHRSVRFYAMAATIMQNRKSYYDILEKTQRNGMDVTPWLEWFLLMLKQTLLDAEQRIEMVMGKARFWQAHAQTVLSPRQIKVLNRLLDAGPSGFEGGLNARKYISMTKVSKATATRDLADLVDKRCLVQRDAGGRSTSYDINYR